jgi:hypothetical protein
MVVCCLSFVVPRSKFNRNFSGCRLPASVKSQFTNQKSQLSNQIFQIPIIILISLQTIISLPLVANEGYVHRFSPSLPLSVSRSPLPFSLSVSPSLCHLVPQSLRSPPRLSRFVRSSRSFLSPPPPPQSLPLVAFP